MIRKLALTSLLSLAVLSPGQQAAAQNNPLGGAIVGGAAGAVLGGALGGGRGAAAGAIVGAATGAAIASQGQPRPGGYSYYQGGCYVQRSDGAWIAVSPRYCAVASNQPVVIDNRPRCMRSPYYDPRTGTVLGRDGNYYPCP
jgi:hypothetical protein